MKLTDFEKKAHESIIYEEHDTVTHLESNSLCEVVCLSNTDITIRNLETNEEIVVTRNDIEPSQLMDDENINEATIKLIKLRLKGSKEDVYVADNEKELKGKEVALRDKDGKELKKVPTTKLKGATLLSNLPHGGTTFLESMNEGINLSEAKKKMQELVKECSCDDEEGLNEEGDVKVEDVIKSLADTDWGKDNEAQMKAVQLLKGLALSDDPKSNEFMKKLSSASTTIAKQVA